MDARRAATSIIGNCYSRFSGASPKTRGEVSTVIIVGARDIKGDGGGESTYEKRRSLP